jgi:hypothetical protein
MRELSFARFSRIGSTAVELAGRHKSACDLQQPTDRRRISVALKACASALNTLTDVRFVETERQLLDVAQTARLSQCPWEASYQEAVSRVFKGANDNALGSIAARLHFVPREQLAAIGPINPTDAIGERSARHGTSLFWRLPPSAWHREMNKKRSDGCRCSIHSRADAFGFG